MALRRRRVGMNVNRRDIVWPMTIPWLPILRQAIAAQGSGPLIVSLATVDSAGEPQVRSVVVRRVTDDGELRITSDARGGKHEQIVRHPTAAVCAWFAATREQFRFSATVRIVAPDSPDRAAIWKELSSATRATFFWPVPGTPKAQSEAFIESSDAPLPPASFELLQLRPISVEHLLLTEHPHCRTRWTLRETWAVEAMNP